MAPFDLFKYCDVPASVTFDPELVLNDDAFGRSRFEPFYCVHSNYGGENRSCLLNFFHMCLEEQ